MTGFLQLPVKQDALVHRDVVMPKWRNWKTHLT